MAKTMKLLKSPRTIAPEAAPSNVRHLFLPVARPNTRGECVNSVRPCPWASCIHHLMIDSISVAGHVRTFFDDVEDMPDTCSLDVADRGPHSLQDVADRTGGLSRARIGQVEVIAFRKLANVLDATMIAEFTAPSEAIPDDSVFTPAFGAMVTAAYERIVPESARPRKLFNYNPVLEANAPPKELPK